MTLRTPANSLVRFASALPVRMAESASLALPLALLLLFASGPGCIGKKPANPATTQPVTNIDPQIAEPSYWLAQPASAEVTADSFDTLWAASEAAAHKYMFPIDQRDYRRGLLVTQPTTTKQFFELWRKDAGTSKDVRESSLGPIRRTVHFQFTRNLDGTYTVAPKVVVERMSVVDPKYTGQIDEPSRYWYALRRDTALEGKIAQTIQDKLRS